MLHVPSNQTSRSLVEMLLAEQQTTAVEKFSQLHERPGAPLQAEHYRDLIPATPPSPGEQYAFEVDLSACSGCKSCVTACHNLNGLEDEEVWRSVGMLHGGSEASPVLQHVTSACHHCVEPACLHGCPVKAYEKDPLTGIVRHLDDQCIGCQYCILKCPYDVPKYSPSKGIVRKCDMCSDRLASAEAPACVQACPHQAIRITVVSQQVVVEESEANVFLPGAPEPSYTLPTTVYKSGRVLPRNLLPADYYSARPAHSHVPLIVMLVLTQMSVGAFVVEQLMQTKPFRAPLENSEVGASTANVPAMHAVLAELPADPVTQIALGGLSPATPVRQVHLLAALLLGFLGLFAAIFHLGRPHLAYRSLIGLASSWLSREILAFNLFAGFASAYVAAACASSAGWNISLELEQRLGLAAAATGLLALGCSMMIYIDTQRVFWNPFSTFTKFLGTAAVTGLPTVLVISLVAATISPQLSIDEVLHRYGRRLCLALAVAASIKMACEATLFAALRQKRHTPLKRTALLLTGELSMPTLARFFFGVVGGIVLPLILLGERVLAPEAGYQPLFVGTIALLVLGLCLLGELLERYLYFTAVVAPKMPGN